VSAPTLESIASDVKARFEAVTADLDTKAREAALAALSDVNLAEQIKASLGALLESEEGAELVRKVRFGQPDAELTGTKYARRGLSVGDVELMHDVLTACKEVGRGTGPSEELSATFKAVSEGHYVSTALARADDQRRLYEMHRSGILDAAGYRRAMLANEAMDTAEAGFGAELIGAQYVSELWTAPRRLGRVFNLLESFEMTDPTAYLPVEVDFPELLYVAENTASNASEYATVSTGSQRVQVDARKFVLHQMWSGEMQEDSIIPFLPFLRRQAALSIAHYGDSLVLNGDTTNAATGNINLDDADPADTKHYLAFDGIRHAFLVDNTANGIDVAGPVTLDDLNSLRALMIDETRKVDWGHPTSSDDLVFLSDPYTADKVAMLDEYLTVDKYGPAATVLNGEAGRILGHRHISTIAMSRTEADGKVSTTGGNNTKGQVAAFNRRGFVLGWRRRVQVEAERLPARDQTRLVFSLRLGMGRFTPTGAASGIEAAAGLYDVAV
jgi:HK97 family phage major capsid protein